MTDDEKSSNGQMTNEVPQANKQVIRNSSFVIYLGAIFCLVTRKPVSFTSKPLGHCAPSFSRNLLDEDSKIIQKSWFVVLCQ